MFGIFLLSNPLPLSYSFTEVNQNWKLDSDFTGSLRIRGGIVPSRFPVINLQGNLLTLDADGIEVKSPTHAATIVNGIVTSSESFLKVRSPGIHTSKVAGGLHITSVIADSSHSVGVRFSGEYGALVFEGSQSNTFTGNVEVSGAGNRLYLHKWNGAVAVKSDILMEKAQLIFHRSDQLSKTSSVTLKDNAFFTYSSLYTHLITNTFKNLVIEEGGLVNFHHSNTDDTLNSKYYIYLDDLIIKGRGLLTVTGWQDERDFILVRKTSANLADALTKMKFEGYDPANIHLRDFNRDYWQISALPEPATYGAFLSTGGLGLWAWRQRRRKRPPRS